jgi:hypothetical protein
MSDGYAVPQDEIESNLRALAAAYPIDIFPDITPPIEEEDERVQKQLGRAAAMIMRHHSRFLLQAADRIAELEAEVSQWKTSMGMAIAERDEVIEELEALLRDAIHRIGNEGFDARWQEAAAALLGGGENGL